MSDQGDKEEPAAKREVGKKGVFARLPLKRTIELPQAVFDLGHGDPVRKALVFNKLNKQPETGASFTLLAASKGAYGLTTSPDGSTLANSDRGNAIVGSNSSQRRKAELDALFNAPAYEALIGKYSHRPFPIDQVAMDFVKGEFSLSDSDAKVCWSVFKQNLADYGLLEPIAGKDMIIPKDILYSAIEPDGSVHVTPGELPSQDEDTPVTPRAPVLPPAPPPISPQFHFNIQIHLPADATSEAYDSIFGSIAKNLLGRDSA